MLSNEFFLKQLIPGDSGPNQTHILSISQGLPSASGKFMIILDNSSLVCFGC